MTPTPAAALGDVRREMTATTRDGRPAWRMDVRRRYPTDAEDLWDALTTAERIPRWFLPVTGDLEVGGHYQLEGNAGGTVLRCDRPSHFGVTWEYGGDVTWVDVRLTPGDDGTTELHLAHVAVEPPREMWEQFGPSAVGMGWDMALYGLGLHVATGETLDAPTVMAWFASPEGLAFQTASSQAWAAADIAAGTDPEQAHAAAARCLAAYTAQPEPQPEPES